MFLYLSLTLQDTAISDCQQQVSALPLKTEVDPNEPSSLSRLSGIPVITAVSDGKVEQSEDWKPLETNGWKRWKEEVLKPAAASLPANSIDGRAVSGAVIAEPVTVVSSSEVCDMRQVKTEQVLNYSSSSSLSEVRAGRVVASIAPCTPAQLNDQLSAWKVPLPSHPPPLLHSSSHDQSLVTSLPTSVIQSPIGIDESSALSLNDSDDSEQELRNNSSSPEPRLLNEECHRSKNAMYVIILPLIFIALFLICS